MRLAVSDRKVEQHRCRTRNMRHRAPRRSRQRCQCSRSSARMSVVLCTARPGVRKGSAIDQTTRRLADGGPDCGSSLTPVAPRLAWRRVTGSVSVRPLQANYLPLPALLSSLLNAVTPSEISCVSHPAGSLLEPGSLPTECFEERLVSPAFTVGPSEQPAHRIVVPWVVTSRVFIRVGEIRHVGKVRGRRLRGVQTGKSIRPCPVWIATCETVSILHCGHPPLLTKPTHRRVERSPA